MNAIGLAVNAVGNHEFDNGPSELLRLQYGGCGAARPAVGAVSCATDMGFSGANFEYLAANVEYKPGLTVFPRYTIRTVGGEPIAFIGMTLKDTASIVSAKQVAGLTFDDEVQTVNALVPELKRQGVSAIVVLVHQGNNPPITTAYSDCGSDAGPVGDMAKMMDPAIDVILSAHTHRAYNCVINGKIVSSAASYGRVVTDVELTIDSVTHSVVGKQANQRIVTRDVTPDPAVDAIVSQFLALTRDVADQVEGWSPVDIPNLTDTMSAQSPMGALIADAMLASVPGAQVALMNVGGVRDGVQAAKLYPTDGKTSDGVITFEKLKTVQPFGNRIVKGLVSGADLKILLEQQFLNQPFPKILQVAGISFHYSMSAAAGSKISQIALVSGGTSTPVDINSTTRNISMVTNDFLGLSGGDGFVQFKQITPPFADTGLGDVNMLAAYTAAQSHPPSGNDPGAALTIPSAQGRVLADP
jgi:5'-nucleotidase